MPRRLHHHLLLPGASLAWMVCLGGCSTPPATPGDPAPTEQAAAKPDPGCEVHSHSGMIRPGDNIPMHMRVQNVGHWCFYGIRFSGQSLLGSRVIDEAAHGEVRLMVRSGVIQFGYRPKPAYVGGDSFIISIPAGFGYDDHVSVTVAVTQ